MISTKWLNHISHKETDRMRMFCFPHTGGSSSYFAKWGAAFGEKDISVCPVEYPLRERRYKDPMPESFQELGKALVEEAAPLFDMDYVFYGHCSGAIIAYEAAKRLAAAGNPPKLLVASASPSPAHTEIQSTIHMTDDELSEFVLNSYMVDEIFLKNKELQAYFLPIIRADLTLYETYACTDATPLPCPILVINGDEDKSAPTQEQMDGWMRFSQATMTRHVFPGDHFFADHNLPEIATLIAGAGRQ